MGNMVCITRQFGKNLPLNYTGNAHLVVLTPRTSLLSGENIKFDVFFVESGNPQKVQLFWKPLGKEKFKMVNAFRKERNHFVLNIPATEIAGNDIEYFIKGNSSANKELYFPATAPERGLTVTMLTTN